MKTADLEGKALDFWVAKALGWNPDVLTHGSIDDIPALPSFPYSRDWTLGGPIIERERIDTISNGPAEWAAGYSLETWQVEMRIGSFGATPLIAAMRAYVASKFGDEVPP